MKINTFIAYASMLLLVVYLLVWNIQPFQYGDTAKFIPDTTLLYVEQKDLVELYRDMERTKLGNQLQSIEILRIAREFGLPVEKIKVLKKIGQIVDENKNNEIFMELFGKKVAFALLQPQTTLVYDDWFNFIKDNSVLIARPRHKAELLQILGESYAKYKENITLSTHQYGNHSIKRFSINGEIISSVTINGFFLVSYSEVQLRRCIDAFDGDLVSLAKSAEYSVLRSRYSKPEQFAFISLENSRSVVEKGLIVPAFSAKDVLENELAATVGFSALSYGAWKERDIFSDRIIVLFDREKVGSEVRKQLETVPSTCDTLKFAPQDPLIFYWTNTFNLELLHRLYSKKTSETGGRSAVFSNTLRDLTGLTTKEFFELFGREISYIVTPGQKGNSLAIPDGIILFKIKNAAKLEIALQDIISSYGFPINRYISSSVTFNYWADAPQDGLQLLYGFWDDYLFIGNSRDLAKQVIDNSISKINSQKNRHMFELKGGLGQGNNYVSYTNNVELIDLTKSVLRLSGAMLAIEDKEAAIRVKKILREVVDPLLDGLTMFKRTATRSYFTENSVVIDSKTEVIH